VKQGDDNALMEVLEKYGPVAVAIDASHYSFTIYHNFIFGSVPNICKSSSIGFVIFFQFLNQIEKYLIFALKIIQFFWSAIKMI
jgi:hypothetical protein